LCARLGEQKKIYIICTWWGREREG